jgi:hypothetical protein
VRERGILAALAIAASACGAGETSVSIVFPNAVSQSAVRRIRVEAYSPDVGAAAASERDCADFENLARDGKEPVGAPVRGDYQCLDPCSPDWLEELALEKVPKGRQIIYVLAYASTEEDATPVLEGCTDQFDSDGGKDEHVEVEIALGLVIPDSARMVKSAGDRQVGRAGEELSVPLEVRIEADSPTGAGGTYVIPGVPVEFTSDTSSFSLVGEPATYTDAAGHASVGVQLPGEPGSGQIIAYAAELEAISDGAERSRQTFSVSVTEPVRAGQSQTIATLPGARPVALAFGDIGDGAGLDLAVLGCMGGSCTVGQAAVEPFGATVATVVMDAGSTQRTIDVSLPNGLGILPAGLVVEDVVPPSGTDDIAVANSRRADCQGRDCEGSEILILKAEGTGIGLEGRYTMTGSNAVGLSTFSSSQMSYRGLAMPAQGRSKNTQPCSRANRCLPINLATPEEGGCPPGERCECPDCNNTNEPGVCVARDKMIDLLVTEALQQGTMTVNQGGCQLPVLSCDNIAPEGSTCECLDAGDPYLRGNGCTGNDGCNCKVPDRIYIGDTDAPVLPFSLASGPLRSQQDWDMVVPSIGGLELIEARSGVGTFLWRGEPIINAPIHAAAILDLDFAAEEASLAPHRADVAWYSRSECLGGSNFASSCAVWRELPEGQTPVGCLGVYFTDGEDSIFVLRTPSVGGCRRHHLDFLPDGMCTGELNGDGNVDVVIASSERSVVYVFSGDGRGGLLDPPDELALPAGGVGGPIACGDVDGDGLDDVAVANATTGSVYLLRTSR